MQNISTPYDDVYRTLLNDCPNLIIPLVNEIFKENYKGNERVELSQNELFFQQADGSEAERITDSSFVIVTERNETKRYHIECQSTPDGSMVIRMFEYDALIAVRNGEQTEKGFVVRFPKSAVLYLRHTKTTKDKLTIRLETPGGILSYDVPVLKVKMYGIEELFQKNLLFLIPFYIFSYEKQFQKMVKDSEKLNALLEEYRGIRRRLDILCESGFINEYTKQTIIAMTENVVNSLARNYEEIREGVTNCMGGKILEYEAKDILNKGKKEGFLIGHMEGHMEGIEQKTKIIILNMLKRNMSDEDICALAECSLEMINEVRETM